MADYQAELRRLSIHCEFGDYLTQALRDRFMVGLSSEAIQKRLLAEANHTLNKAVSVAQGMEAADKNAKGFKNTDSAIHSLQYPQGKIPFTGKPPFSGKTEARHKGQPCKCCGRANYSLSKCRFRDAECHNCGKKGHIASVCRNKTSRKPLASFPGSLGGNN